MCNFYGHKVTKMDFIQLQDIELQLGTYAAMQHLQELISGFAYGNAPVIRKNEQGGLEVVSMHWEFIPFWIKTMDAVHNARKQGIRWLNATSEKLLESKMFRNAALNRRCLVPASHFFEWRSYKPVSAKKEIKYPYCIEVKNKDYFFMAGIWQPFADTETGETMDSFAIVTTKANALMEQVHNSKKRMPVILPDELALKWLDNQLTEDEIKEMSAYQFPATEMKAYSISKNFKIADEPLMAYQYEELPDLKI